MVKIDKQEQKLREEGRVVLNFGFVHVLDRELQKQLDDLNEMKRLNPNTKSRKK